MHVNIRVVNMYLLSWWKLNIDIVTLVKAYNRSKVDITVRCRVRCVLGGRMVRYGVWVVIWYYRLVLFLRN